MESNGNSNSCFVNAPEHVAEAGHVAVSAKGDAQEIVHRREGSAHSDSLGGHSVDEVTCVASDINHDEVGLRVNVGQSALPQPFTKLTPNANELGSPLGY